MNCLYNKFRSTYCCPNNHIFEMFKNMKRMKILLLGEFSSVHYNLKEELVKLGHEVVLISGGDGFKSFKTDLKTYIRKPTENKYIGAIKEIKSQLKISREIKNYDIVQTASHLFFHNRIDKYLFDKIFERNKKTVLLNTACSTLYKEYVSSLKYRPCDSCRKFDLKDGVCDTDHKEFQKVEKSRLSKYDAIVSTHFEYYKGFDLTDYQKKHHFIPVLIKEEDFGKPIDSVTGKINVYYGETRKGFKGGEIIESAIKEIESSEFASEFNFIRSRRLSYQEYLKLLETTHVLIDQINSYSYGVNALIGLAQGKIVLSGGEKEAIDFIGSKHEDFPIFNITPDKDSIIKQLLYLLENKRKFNQFSTKGINYIKKYHNNKSIAKQYEAVYKTILRE